MKTKLLIAFVILAGLGGGVYFIAGTQTKALDVETEISEDATRLSRIEADHFASEIETPDRVLLDIRTPDEYVAGHLEGAQNIDFYADDFETQLQSLDRTVPYAVYCRSDNRSGQTLTLMKSLGFQDVVELKGGIVAWEASGRKTCNKC